MARLSPSERRQQGDAAEQKFMGWLDRCVLPYMYVEQSPLTVPKGLKGEIKRPDFLVGIPTIGTIAIDVKAKRIYDNAIIIDDYEHRTFMNFETFFNMSVWYVCFPPGEPETCHLFLNRDLAGLQSSQRGGSLSLSVPLTATVTADPRRDFMAVLLSAISLR
jgi:hypothetical protein